MLFRLHMPKALRRFLILFTCVAITVATYALFRKAPIQEAPSAEKIEKSLTGEGLQDSNKAGSPENAAEPKIDGKAPSPQRSPTLKTPIILDRDNFERLVLECFRGHPCNFGEDPWHLYQYYKRSQHPRVCDSIIAVMRRKMEDPVYKEKNKALLLAMIQDFYPSTERDFQIAAYYAYLGELQKSVDLYLDLEKKSAKDSSLRPAPKLNIANVYYDLHKFREALPYYQAALKELLTGPETSSDQRSQIQFVQKRIEQIENELSS